MASCSSLNFTAISSNPQKLPSSSISSPTVQRPFISHLSFSKSSSLHSDQIPIRTHCGKLRQPNGAGFVVLGCSRKKEPLRIMISGAPASGKGTQCELITQKRLYSRNWNLIVCRSQHRIQYPLDWLGEGHPSIVQYKRDNRC